MKKLRLPAIVLFALVVGFVILLAITSRALPARVATHFDWSGKPNDWMTRQQDLTVMAAVGLALPLVVVLGIFALRFAPQQLVKLPHRDHWLAPERRGETFAYLFQRSLWFACMTLCFMSALHCLIIDANLDPHPRMQAISLLTVAACFLMGVLIWGASLVGHFSNRRA